ncbi:hypothetical protein ACRE_061930 [Hapsidospora chrysogenum ATCC 11550]|uniref:Uncharacterized protein n=2 Tax=Hapsidospora chrysogena TaxID=5044 RepID=A0A086T146_HAPC1|nr:cell wall galactomannoprotein Mp2-like protein [Hapsidospora chrysogena]KFH43078.1 hypothetical protein ACRE_061930 [Hapsidospora chrysogenum ATCC 11550]
MKLSIHVAAACLASGAVSNTVTIQDNAVRHSIVGRDAAAVSEVLNTVGSDILELDSAVKAFNGEPGPLEQAAQALLDSIKQGTQTIGTADDMTLGDALALQDPVKNLGEDAKVLTEDLKAKKPVIQQAGLCDTTLQQVTQIKDASEALIDAAISKLPGIAQGIAEDFASDMVDVLEHLQGAFSEANCVDADQSTANPRPTSDPPTPSNTPSPSDTPAPPGQAPTAAAATVGPAAGALFIALLGALV